LLPKNEYDFQLLIFVCMVDCRTITHFIPIGFVKSRPKKGGFLG
jgi:hypothetical protein